MVRRYKDGWLRDISDIDIPWENPRVCWEDDSGAYSIVACASQWDWWLETYFLAHCLGTKDYAQFSKAHVVFSLRDRLGVPHATILCVREDEYSPYGRSWDIGSYNTFIPEHEHLRILQVRGRNDDIAMPVFHAIVRDWYVSHDGKIDVDITRLIDLLKSVGDDDVDYHFRYLLDEERNPFQWAHWNTRVAEAARRQGTSL